MGFENHKTVVRRSILALITLYYLLPNEFVDGRTSAAGRDGFELAKHKGTLKSIESENGQVIDCVDIYKQPSFDLPLPKNHNIEPNSIQNRVKGENNQALMVLQGWHKNGECPEGTIPIVRTLRSINFSRTAHSNSHISTQHNRASDFIAPPGHEYAQVTLTGGKYYGTNATLNVWTPAAYGIGLFSLAQVWVLSGQKEELNSIEAGWIVHPGDTKPQFFIYWTRDGYKTTGCYNLECPGFVQINKQFALGSTIEPVSSYNGPQVNIIITIYKNKESGHWWLQVQNQTIGYWPDSIFTTLANGSDAPNWGGEIINDEPEGHHTLTQMGSGHFSSEGYGKACYFHNLKYMDDAGVFKDPGKLIPYVTKPLCYDLQVGEDTSSEKGTFFYFGGPGYSKICPT